MASTSKLACLPADTKLLDFPIFQDRNMKLSAIQLCKVAALECIVVNNYREMESTVCNGTTCAVLLMVQLDDTA